MSLRLSQHEYEFVRMPVQREKFVSKRERRAAFKQDLVRMFVGFLFASSGAIIISLGAWAWYRTITPFLWMCGAVVVMLLSIVAIQRLPR